MEKRYVLYDERYLMDKDSAMVYCTANTLKEAKGDKKDMFPDAVIVEYEVVKGTELINGRIIK
jgi:hypothetical protein